MECISSEKKEIIRHIILQLLKACDMIIEWNKEVTSEDDYLMSSDGMQKMAASCMLVESIGEGVKKIDKVSPGLLLKLAPNVPWREVKGLRDHIAHGYLNIDSSIVYDVSINEIAPLKLSLEAVLHKL
jgi:uncharacterized protein with HEPN domain